MNVHFSLEKYGGKEPVATIFFLLLKINKYSIIFYTFSSFFIFNFFMGFFQFNFFSLSYCLSWWV